MGFILGPNGANLPFEMLVSCLICAFESFQPISPRQVSEQKLLNCALEGFQPISPEQVSEEKLLNFGGQPVGVQRSCLPVFLYIL